MTCNEPQHYNTVTTTAHSASEGRLKDSVMMKKKKKLLKKTLSKIR